MIYALRLYTVQTERIPTFVAAFNIGGLWTETRHLQPGYLHTDLLRNPLQPSRFISIEFWTSLRSLLAAQRSPQFRSVVRWLQRQALASEHIGVFTFPPRPITAESAPDGLPSEIEFLINGISIPESGKDDTEVRP